MKAGVDIYEINKLEDQDLIQLSKIVKAGGVGVIPTDTIYGLVGSALNKSAVARLYKLKQRTSSKPNVILISSLKDLEIFGIRPTQLQKRVINKLWPGPFSIIFPCQKKKWQYLHRDTNTLAFRLPASANLLKILKKVGPLCAPSANLQNLPPAQTIQQAQDYFSNKADFYINGGELISAPSTVLKIDPDLEVLRQGLGQVPKELIKIGY